MLPYQHALALFLFLGVPIWDALETRALKTSTNPRRKILSYQRIVLILWTAAILAWFTLRSSVFFIWTAVHLTAQQKIGASFGWGFAIAFAGGSSPPQLNRARKDFARLSAPGFHPSRNSRRARLVRAGFSDGRHL